MLLNFRYITCERTKKQEHVPRQYVIECNVVIEEAIIFGDFDSQFRVAEDVQISGGYKLAKGNIVAGVGGRAAGLRCIKEIYEDIMLVRRLLLEQNYEP